MNKVRSDIYCIGAVLSIGLARLVYEVDSIWAIVLIFNGLVFTAYSALLEFVPEKK